jgi:hypothetical protein
MASVGEGACDGESVGRSLDDFVLFGGTDGYGVGVTTGVKFKENMEVVALIEIVVGVAAGGEAVGVLCSAGAGAADGAGGHFKPRIDGSRFFAVFGMTRSGSLNVCSSEPDAMNGSRAATTQAARITTRGRYSFAFIGDSPFYQ